MVFQNRQTVSFQFFQGICGNCRIRAVWSPGGGGDLQKDLVARNARDAFGGNLLPFQVNLGRLLWKAFHPVSARVRPGGGAQKKK